MEKRCKNFSTYLNEYWATDADAPGTVVVPGEWQGNNINSRNYKPDNTRMPNIIDPLLEDSEFEKILDEMKDDLELIKKIKGSGDPLEIIDIIKNFIKLKRAK